MKEEVKMIFDRVKEIIVDELGVDEDSSIQWNQL